MFRKIHNNRNDQSELSRSNSELYFYQPLKYIATHEDHCKYEDHGWYEDHGKYEVKNDLNKMISFDTIEENI